MLERHHFHREGTIAGLASAPATRFDADDLRKERNLHTVAHCLFSLGRAVARAPPPGFRGPHLFDAHGGAAADDAGAEDGDGEERADAAARNLEVILAVSEYRARHAARLGEGGGGGGDGGANGDEADATLGAAAQLRRESLAAAGVAPACGSIVLYTSTTGGAAGAALRDGAERRVRHLLDAKAVACVSLPPALFPRAPGVPPRSLRLLLANARWRAGSAGAHTHPPRCAYAYALAGTTSSTSISSPSGAPR